jgi:mannose-1-phosphate guanylyltransferase
MSHKDMIHVVLCGGSGTRLWPLSRESKPKQLINFFDQKTLLQKSIIGNQKQCSEFLVVCNDEHFHLIQKQLSEYSLTPQKYILEAIPRNTAAAVCFALLTCDPKKTILITPADHDIDYSEAYINAIDEAKQSADQNQVTVFGISPTNPETGYGYIEIQSDHTVKRFHEKPSLEVAKHYLKQGDFYWNSGMICAKVEVLLKLMLQHAPDILQKAEHAYRHAFIRNEHPAVYKIPYEEMINIPVLSIDHAILEKTSNLKCVPGAFRWTDMGSFDSLFTFFPKDEGNNVVNAKQFVSINSKNNLIMGHHRLISMVDVEDLAVVDTPDALLISRLGTTQNVREVVHKLRDTNKDVLHMHAEKSCPWGSFTVLESTDMCKVKRLIVHPGKRLSLQKHLYRSEHWVVVAGTALVTVGKEKYLLHPNQSVFIPKEEQHRIENPGDVDVVIIEVQFGEYTGEDDIIRIEDDFGRAPKEAEQAQELTPI